MRLPRNVKFAWKAWVSVLLALAVSNAVLLLWNAFLKTGGCPWPILLCSGIATLVSVGGAVYIWYIWH